MTTNLIPSIFRYFLVAIIAFSAIPALSEQPPGLAGDDPDYVEAVVTARSLLPQFWERFASPADDEGDFALKINVAEGNVVEEFWVIDIERNGSEFSGVLDNEPSRLRTVKKGVRLTFTEDDIEDWMFLRNNKIVGNFTLRVLIRVMPDDEAELYEGLLEDL